MAVVELCSENSGVSMTPRISFSHDFSQSDFIPVEQNPFRSNSSGLNSSFDFDVCVCETSEHESSSADELFSGGKMLPTEIKKKKKTPHQQQQPQSSPSRLESVRENASMSKKSKNKKQHVSDEVDEKQSSCNNNNNSNIKSSSSFWGFKRSSSCGSGGYGRSLCPLPLLSRSNSTGSSSSTITTTPSVKRMSLSNMKQQNPQKYASTRPSSSSNLKPPLKKNYGGPYGHSNSNGVRVNPVLNVPSASLFGLGSIFSTNKDKTKKK